MPPPYHNNVPYQPRREPYYNGQLPLTGVDGGIDRIGDYVARHLVPVMLGRSDRPLQLVMNFGHLEIDDGLQASGGSRSTSSRGASNAVLYNAPGCVMAIAGSRQRRDRDQLGGYTIVNPSDEMRMGPAMDRRIGICTQCYRRQLVAPTGYCIDCDMGYRGRERTLYGSSSGMDRGWDGVRYRSAYEPRPSWKNSIEREQWERNRNRERLLQSYYSDSDISGRW